MRNPQRIRQILGAIYLIWAKHPDMRFGQLTYNLYSQFCVDKKRPVPKDFFYVEDDEFLEWLQKFEGLK